MLVRALAERTPDFDCARVASVVDNLNYCNVIHADYLSDWVCVRYGRAELLDRRSWRNDVPNSYFRG